MPWFMCESCGETLKKPKVNAHAQRCAAEAFSCIDCSATFDRWSVRGHVSCVTEHEKYALAATKPGGEGIPRRRGREGRRGRGRRRRRRRRRRRAGRVFGDEAAVDVFVLWGDVYE